MTLFIKPACTHSWFHHWLHYNSGSYSWLRPWLLAPRWTVTRKPENPTHVGRHMWPPKKKRAVVDDGMALMISGHVHSLGSSANLLQAVLTNRNCWREDPSFWRFVECNLDSIPETRTKCLVLVRDGWLDGCYCNRDPSYPIPDIIVIIKPDGMGIN